MSLEQISKVIDYQNMPTSLYLLLKNLHKFEKKKKFFLSKRLKSFLSFPGLGSEPGVFLFFTFIFFVSSAEPKSASPFVFE